MNQVPFGAAGETSVHPAVLVAVLVAIILIFVLSRKYVVAPMLLVSILVPMGQMVMIGTFHFHMFRIVILFGWIRLLWQRYASEGRSSKIHITSVDKAVIFYITSCIVCYVLLWQQIGAFTNQIGKLYNVLGFYFFFRFFVRTQEDVERTIKVMAVVALIVGACMFNEQVTGRNILGVLGGVPEFTTVRQGYLRSQGPFRVYLTAGAFGATLLPLFLILWRKGGPRVTASIGIIAAITIAITSRTSTAISACLATVIGLGMWVFRRHMRLLRWGIVSTLVGLHLVMKAPVWALIAKVDFVGGSTSWHRFKIIDNCINHFWDWWLVGATNYQTWEGGDDMWDLANQFVFTAQTTGLLSLILFLASIIYCFKALGTARMAVADDMKSAWFLWLLGVALFSNVVAFFGISYFDQTFICWYALLAMIVTATSLPRKTSPVQPSTIPIISTVSRSEFEGSQTASRGFGPIPEGHF